MNKNGYKQLKGLNSSLHSIGFGSTMLQPPENSKESLSRSVTKEQRTVSALYIVRTFIPKYRTLPSFPTKFGEKKTEI
jgi:hypothetical protein